MKKTYKSVERESLKISFEKFIKENKNLLNSPTNDGHATTYKSVGGSITLSIDDLHPSQKGLGGYTKKIIPKNTVRIEILHIKYSFLGLKNTESKTYKIQNDVDTNLKVNNRDNDLYLNILKLKNRYLEILEELRNEYENEVEEKRRKSSQELKLKIARKEKTINNFNKQKNEILLNFDKDQNGVIDIIEDEPFKEILQKYQNQIISIDKSYIHQFVKISSYLNDKKTNIQNTFKSLNEVSKIKDLKIYVGILKNQIHTYKVLLFHSISMITSLIKEEQDLFTFYEIYEHFDKLNIFQTNHEKEISEELKQLNLKTSQVIDSLGDIMYRINSFENSMIERLDELTYTTGNGFDSLKGSISSELKSINSSINLNNLLTGIQTYQMYKINKNTKSLRG